MEDKKIEMRSDSEIEGNNLSDLPSISESEIHSK